MKLFFDCETTGKADFRAAPSAAHQPHIVQLGALLTQDDGTERGVVDVIIKPEGWEIPKEASDIHGITTEIADACGVPIFAALSVFNRMLQRASVLVAHNIDFDYLMLEIEFCRLKKELSSEGFERFCTMRATTDLCCLPGNYGYKWPKLTEAHFHFFGEHVKGAHDAMTDVRACKRIYFRIHEATPAA